MKHNLRFGTCFFLLLFFGVILSACKDKTEDSPTPPQPGPNPNSSLRARISEVNWEANDGIAFSWRNNVLEFSGQSKDDSRKMYMLAVNVPAPGTYNIGSGQNNSYAQWTDAQGNTFSSANATGTVVVSVLTPTQVSGTYSFVGRNGNRSVNVTNGAFRLYR